MYYGNLFVMQYKVHRINVLSHLFSASFHKISTIFMFSCCSVLCFTLFNKWITGSVVKLSFFIFLYKILEIYSIVVMMLQNFNIYLNTMKCQYRKELNLHEEMCRDELQHFVITTMSAMSHAWSTIFYMYVVYLLLFN